MASFRSRFLCRFHQSFSVAGLWLLGALVSGGATLPNCDEASLRQAVTNGGTITFACDGTIVLSAPLVVDRDTVLDGNGHQVTLSGGNAVRVIEVNPGIRFEIRALTIANGFVAGTNSLELNGAGQGAFGAGILNRGSLTLIDCFFRSNVVRGGIGGPRDLSPSTNSGGFARGAAIDKDGAEVWATNCVFAANSSVGGAGGPPGTPIPQYGDGGDAFGAAFFTRMGAYAFSGCRFSSNVVHGGASGSGVSYNGGRAGSAYGGAIGSIQSTGLVVDGVFMANQATGAGLSWNGVEAGEARGGAVFNDAGRLNIIRTLVASSRAEAGPVSRNGAGGSARGGGVANGGEVTMSDSFILNNVTLGGLATRTSIFAFGGGLDNWGTAIVAGCTFQANEAIGGVSQAAFGTPAPGGAAYGGAANNTGSLFATNCTLSGNVARGGDSVATPAGTGHGGGLAAVGGLTFLSHITIASNMAVNGVILGGNPLSGLGGGIYVANNAPILQNSILAHSQFGSNAFGALVDAGNNISSDGSCQFTQPGSRNNVDPLLSSLADFGGPTPTMALLVGSPAIDAGLPCLCVPTDQRGRPRPSGAVCDVGAFEASAPVAVRLTINAVSSQDQTVVLAGQSGDRYEVQRSQAIAGPWTSLSTNIIGPNGTVTFQVPLSGGASFLRARKVSP